MFLTRSKTISAISSERRADNKESEDDPTFPTIPNELISVFENATSAIETSVKQILPEEAQQLMLNMVAAWIVYSRLNQSKHSTKAVTKPSQPTFFRSWTTRSFLIRSKSSITPFSQQAEILNVVSIEKLRQLTSLSHESLLTDGSEEERETGHKTSVSSVQSIADVEPSFLPSLVSDQRSSSFIEETLTPPSATSVQNTIDGIALSDRTEQGEIDRQTLSLGSETNNMSSTAPYSRDIQPVRRSLSSIFTHLGHSVKKAFKKKARTDSVNHLKKTFSIQQDLSSQQESEESSPLHKNIKRSFSSVIMEEDQMLSENEDEMQSMSDAQTSRYDDEAETPLQESGMSHLSYGNPEFSSYANNYSHFSSLENTDNSNGCSALFSSEKKEQNDTIPALYWDEDSTQSQQFNRLLDDIRETSQEYQDYFAAEQQQQVKESSHKMMRASRTEGNMDRINDAVPYVCVGKDSRRNSVIARVSPQVSSKKLLNIEDIKAYKRSTSVYSKIQDYDLKWQASFHEEQKSRDKVAKTLKSVSWAFYNMVKHNHKMSEFYCDEIFDENGASMSDLSEYQHYAEPLTEWNDIYDQLAYVFDCGELTSEHAIITFVYVQRMLSISDQKLWDFSWRMIIMSSLLTAVKVWDDCAIFNADFAMIFPELTLDVINNIERVFLKYLEWDVSVSCSDFARTYFHLRQIEHMMEQW